MADARTTSDINPYAPPSVLDPLVKPDPGVGVWRDGSAFVTHRDAILPPICIKTGGPAAEWVDLKLPTFDLYLMGSAKFTLRVPISARTAWLRVYGTGIAVAAATAAFLPIPILIFWETRPSPAWGVFALVTGAAGLMAILQAISFRQMLSFCRVKRDYFWFAGAHRRFLAQLPPWPGLD
jgi:hypothetical protein